MSGRENTRLSQNQLQSILFYAILFYSIPVEDLEAKGLTSTLVL